MRHELLKRHPEHEEPVVVEKPPKPKAKKKKPRGKYAGIRCPKCAWQPLSSSRWWCNREGCGCTWNTFDTRGKCPKCSYQWRDTACLECSQWSKHEDWYEAPSGPRLS
jgi:hypothetical protein